MKQSSKVQMMFEYKYRRHRTNELFQYKSIGNIQIKQSVNL